MCVPGAGASQTALLCCRHMVLLKEQYGKQVVVNLLGNRGGEEVLNRAFKVTGPLPWARPSEEVGGGLPWGLETVACSPHLWGDLFPSELQH